MSSEPLLRAEGIEKVFISPTSPGKRLLRALLGPMVKTKDFPVLRAIDLTVESGERVGIIGRNGAGKTTLLSILGGVTKPTGGRVYRRGRVAVLLGTSGAFNQNFTGRENAELYTRLMGFEPGDTNTLIAQIEAFAGLERYFDMPVRTYSSGMIARLSFACAAHVEADLIILDEALAVGDAEFRMKCYTYMDQRARQQQSYLLVSHSPNVIANFCTRALVMDKGRILFDGPPREATTYYKDMVVEKRRVGRMNVNLDQGSSDRFVENPDQHVEIRPLQIRFDHSNTTRTGIIEIDVSCVQTIPHPVVKLNIRSHEGVIIFGFQTGRATPPLLPLKAGQMVRFRIIIDDRFCAGQYWIDFSLQNGVIEGSEKIICFLQNAAQFSVEEARATGLVDLTRNFEIVELGRDDLNDSALTGISRVTRSI